MMEIRAQHVTRLLSFCCEWWYTEDFLEIVHHLLAYLAYIVQLCWVDTRSVLTDIIVLETEVYSEQNNKRTFLDSWNLEGNTNV